MPEVDDQGEPYTYTVVEKPINDYETSYSDDTLTITNTIKKKTVTVTKTFKGIETSHIPTSFKIVTNYQNTEFNLTGNTPVNGENGSKIYTWTISDVPVGTTINLEEQGYNHSWYTVETNPVAVNDKVSTSLKVTTDGINNVAFVNTYSRKVSTVDVKKLVTGNMGDRSADFSFTAEFTKTDGTKTTENFTLKHGQTKQFTNVQWGTTVKITEAEDSSYDTSSQLNNGEWKKQHEVTIEHVENEYYTVTFENGKEVKIDTGVPMTTFPYLVLLGLIPLAGIGAFLMYRKRRRDEA